MTVISINDLPDNNFYKLVELTPLQGDQPSSLRCMVTLWNSLADVAAHQQDDFRLWPFPHPESKGGQEFTDDQTDSLADVWEKWMETLPSRSREQATLTLLNRLQEADRGAMYEKTTPGGARPGKVFVLFPNTELPEQAEVETLMGLPQPSVEFFIDFFRRAEGCRVELLGGDGRGGDN